MVCTGCLHSETLCLNFDINNNVGTIPFGVNTSMVYGMQSIGRSYSDLETICGILNMAETMTQNNFIKLSN